MFALFYKSYPWLYSFVLDRSCVLSTALVRSQKLLCTPDRSCILLSIYEYFRLLFRRTELSTVNWRTLFYLHPAQINEKQRDSLIYGSYALLLMIVNANEWKYVTSLSLFFFFDKADSFFPLIFGVQSLRHVEREIKWAMLGILE